MQSIEDRTIATLQKKAVKWSRFSTRFRMLFESFIFFYCFIVNTEHFHEFLVGIFKKCLWVLRNATCSIAFCCLEGKDRKSSCWNCLFWHWHIRVTDRVFYFSKFPEWFSKMISALLEHPVLNVRLSLTRPGAKRAGWADVGRVCR